MGWGVGVVIGCVKAREDVSVFRCNLLECNIERQSEIRRRLQTGGWERDPCWCKLCSSEIELAAGVVPSIDSATPMADVFEYERLDI